MWVPKRKIIPFIHINHFFCNDHCTVYHNNETKIFAANKQGNLYKINMDELSVEMVSYLMFEKEDH